MAGAPYLTCRGVALGTAVLERPDSHKDMLALCTNHSCHQAILYDNVSTLTTLVNGSVVIGQEVVKVAMSGRDASWILTSAVIIFTMQTGQ